MVARGARSGFLNGEDAHWRGSALKLRIRLIYRLRIRLRYRLRLLLRLQHMLDHHQLLQHYAGLLVLGQILGAAGQLVRGQGLGLGLGLGSGLVLGLGSSLGLRLGKQLLSHVLQPRHRVLLRHEDAGQRGPPVEHPRPS